VAQENMEEEDDLEVEKETTTEKEAQVSVEEKLEEINLSDDP